MIYNPTKKEIILNRELSKLDKFVIDFCNLLDDYVLVSGYVSIIFGRSRGTEDVDLLIPEMNSEEFKKLWKKVYENGFECVNTENPKEAFVLFKEHNINWPFLCHYVSFSATQQMPVSYFPMFRQETSECDGL